MSETTGKNNSPADKIHWRVVGMLALILIILPAGSWYYLTKGYQYRKELLNDLQQDYGMVSNYNLRTADGQPFSFTEIKNNTAIVHFAGEEINARDATWLQMTKLHEQFDERNDILFISHLSGNTVSTAPRDTAQWKIITGESTELARIARENYRLNFPVGQDILDNSQLILLDSAQIRNYYDATDAAQVARLLEHITIVMPREEEKDIILERDKEM